MSVRRLTGLYRSRALADEAAQRLAAAGLGPAEVAQEALAESQAGVFDKLARLLAADSQAAARGFVVQLSAPLGRVEEAAIALEPGADRVEVSAPPQIAEQVIELSETAERLVVDTEPVLVEEIVMHVQARERTQDVHDTLRRTEVEVERFGPDGRERKE